MISVTERQSYILRVRDLAKACCEAWLVTQKKPALSAVEGAADGRAASRASERRDPGAHAGARRRRSQAAGQRRAEGRRPRVHRRARLRDAAPAGAGRRRPAGGAGRCQRRAARPAGRRARAGGAGLPEGRGSCLARPGGEARHRQGRVLVRRDRQEGRADRRGAARHHRRRHEGAALAQVDEVGQRHHDLGASAAVHRGAVRRQGAGGRGRAGRRRWRRSGSATPRAAIASSARATIKVADFADYAAKLRAAHVVLDPAERKKIMLDGGGEALCRRPGRAAARRRPARRGRGPGRMAGADARHHRWRSSWTCRPKC